MNNLLLSIILILTAVFTSHANAQKTIDCVSHKDLQQIAQSFSQFQQFLGTKDLYCEAELGSQWLKIANSLAVLINTQLNEPDSDEDDAFTSKAISESNWWAYFTKRANNFAIQTNCRPNVVAYVSPFLGMGSVNLCLLFFDLSVSSQASTMMHEVRHFDGFGHVTCSQGNENGVAGACDAKITDKGSYAVDVQTLVGMARSSDTSQNEKPLLEAEAVYMAFNKFNEVPKLKLRTSIILSNQSGEVYEWSLTEGLSLIKTLPEPSLVINSSNNLTIYPIKAQSDAYRMDKYLTVDIENPGLYAKKYNSETPEERLKYKSFSYFGTGGILKGNTLFALCDSKTPDLGETNLDDKGNFVTIISMSADKKDEQRESLLLAENGDLYNFECQDSSSNLVKFTKSELKMASQTFKVVDSFGFDSEQYALLDNGALAIVTLENNILEPKPLELPMQNNDWISATPLSQPEVF